MMIAVLPTLDHVKAAWPRLLLGSVVDDIQVIAVESFSFAGDICEDLSAAMCFIADDLAEQGLPISMEENKLVVMVSSRVLRLRLSNQRFRQFLRHHTRNLGVDFAFGHRSTIVQGKRLCTANRRAHKLKAVRKAGSQFRSSLGSQLLG